MSETIAECVWRFVAGWPDAPCTVSLEAMAAKAPAMAVQQMGGTVREKRFVNGGYIGRWPFAVRVRVDGTDTAARLAAVAWLGGLSDWMAAQPLPGLGEGTQALRLEMVGLPAQAAAYADGLEDYQAVFTIWYRVKGA